MPNNDAQPHRFDDDLEWKDINDMSMYNQSPLAGDIDAISDKDWITESFTRGFTTLHPDVQLAMIRSPADNSFIDSSLGGNYSLNAKPQFTPYSDPRRGVMISSDNMLDYDSRSGMIAGNTDFQAAVSPAIYNKHKPVYSGVGRTYFEKIEVPKQTIRLVFGVPKFSSLLAFWTSFLNPDVEILARTGTYPGTLVKSISAGIGALMLLTAAAPAIIVAWVTKYVLTLLFGSGGGRYYRVEPTPHVYISTWNTAINHFIAKIGLYPGLSMEQSKAAGDKYNPSEAAKIKAQHELEVLRTHAPFLFTENYGVDMFAVMGRTEAVRQATMTAVAKRLSNNNGKNGVSVGGDTPKALYSIRQGFLRPTSVTTATNFNTLYELIGDKNSTGYVTEEYQTKKIAQVATAGASSATPPSPSSSEGSENSQATEELVKEQAAKLDNFSSDILHKKGAKEGDELELDIEAAKTYSDWLAIFMKKGSLYTTIDVDYTGPITETFTNSAADIESGQSFNSRSSEMRSTRFNIAGGNLADGVIGNAIESTVSGIASVAMGVANFATAGAASSISALFRAAEIEMPKRYESSEVTLSGSSYSFTLTCSSGSKYAQVTEVWIPILGILSGTIPIKTGNNSHTSPLMCSLDDCGKSIISAGLISKFSITRGEGNAGFTVDDETLSVKCELEILDLAPIISIPISTGSMFNTLTNGNPIKLDSSWAEYMDTITARTIAERTFTSSRMRLSKRLARINKESALSKSAISHSIMTSGPGSIITGIFSEDIESKL